MARYGAKAHWDAMEALCRGSYTLSITDSPPPNYHCATWRGEQCVYVTIEASGFQACTPIVRELFENKLVSADEVAKDHARNALHRSLLNLPNSDCGAWWHVDELTFAKLSHDVQDAYTNWMWVAENYPETPGSLDDDENSEVARLFGVVRTVLRFPDKASAALFKLAEVA